MQGRSLETLTWPQAEQAPVELPVALLPIGARAKEHGHHLPLNNDWLLAEYFTRRVLEQFPALALKNEDICMEYTDLRSMLSDVDDKVREPEAGTHADEIETSIMLYIHSEVVKLQQAKRNIDPRGRSGSLTRNPNAK